MFAKELDNVLYHKTKVVYHNSKPTDLEKSERVVLKGKMEADHFECKDILLKCPSKYKDEMKPVDKNLPTSMTAPSDKKADPKY